MQAIYQLDVQGDDFLGGLELFLKQESDDDMVFTLARDWARGTWEHLPTCDDLIRKAALKWDLSRLSVVDRSILRLSVYQIRYCSEIPGKVVINEAIEIAKKYSGDQSPRFVNGVLDAVLKKIRDEDR
ncbi:putative N utilization substance protein B [Anaerohalosphaera lusitana]|uniref:Transcription antitermination protein NusB n=2 Tax=Anaerohalosphaera lusitana TaxID=1936003 RepID=A0A1U9NGG4_9BACT|nr:putative N utilization substance protein B [Anaerohalosphaera lusitana]